MRCHVRNKRKTGVRTAGLLVAALLSLLIWPGSASAHGSVVDPASRNYGCWARWGDDFQNPAMAQEDPMCWQAWQANPNAMWNWNGLYRNGLAGNFEAAIPDGQLCSGGHAESDRYDALDAVGAWQTTSVADDFTVTLNDQAAHGADYFKVYVSRQGFDPTSRPLGWGDLQLLTTTGRYAPANTYAIDVSTSGLTGRHVVYTIWQASHMDQAYFLCSDVDFG
ncbi:lytic polysaccharide monooxygenase [Streptomyces sp. NPDC059740]|uniref:lytic polysaccharide monooxygenase auxiliary activity family 9 protein n=1 Tax=Streptomyces sp. NPDC059740 TaxID=3346926 RepID=UPI0036699145